MKPTRPLLALFFLPLVALAQPRDPVTAEALFRQGREAIKAGQIEEGCAKIIESQRLDPAPGTLLSVADCAERRGKLATARLHYLDLIELVPPSDPRRALAEKKARDLEKRIPRLTVRLARDAPEGTRVLRDGAPLGAAALGSPLPVDPGAHLLETSAPGRLTARLDLSLREGETREVSVAPGLPEPAPAASPTPPPSSAPPALSASAPPATSSAAPTVSNATPTPTAVLRGNRTAGWLLVGGGGVAVGVSMLLGLQVLDRKETVEAHCRNKECDQEGLDAASSGRSYATASTLTFVLGAAAAGVGTYLLLTSSPRAEVSAGLGGIRARFAF
jgi:hypothetical protein